MTRIGRYQKIQDLQKLELHFRLLYFLRDLGIRSSFEPAAATWTDYMARLGKMIAEDACSTD
jgi:hypothetical protein